MASFDVVSKVDHQLLDNTINTTRKEILGRFDFKGSNTEIELDKKTLVVRVTTDNEMQLGHIEDVLLKRAIKQGVDPTAFDFQAEAQTVNNRVRKEIPVREGIDKELAKKLQKLIKDSKLKVQASLMDDQLRVTGKNIDDLQAVIALLRQHASDQPLQFVNMKR